MRAVSARLPVTAINPVARMTSTGTVPAFIHFVNQLFSWSSASRGFSVVSPYLVLCIWTIWGLFYGRCFQRRKCLFHLSAVSKIVKLFFKRRLAVRIDQMAHCFHAINVVLELFNR